MGWGRMAGDEGQSERESSDQESSPKPPADHWRPRGRSHRPHWHRRERLPLGPPHGRDVRHLPARWFPRNRHSPPIDPAVGPTVPLPGVCPSADSKSPRPVHALPPVNTPERSFKFAGTAARCYDSRTIIESLPQRRLREPVELQPRQSHVAASAPGVPDRGCNAHPANGQRQLAGGDVPRTNVLRVPRRPTQSDAVGLGPIGIHVGLRKRRFHHGADAPRWPGLRPTLASAARCRQHSVGERPASAGWWRRPTHKRSASPTTCHAARPSWSSPDRPTRAVTRPKPGQTQSAARFNTCQYWHRQHPRQAVWALPLATARSASTWECASGASTMGLTPHVRRGCAPVGPGLICLCQTG